MTSDLKTDSVSSDFSGCITIATQTTAQHAKYWCWSPKTQRLHHSFTYEEASIQVCTCRSGTLISELFIQSKFVYSVCLGLWFKKCSLAMAPWRSLSTVMPVSTIAKSFLMDQLSIERIHCVHSNNRVLCLKTSIQTCI